MYAALQRVGGPGAVTWWAFWISLADRLVTVSVQPINASVPLYLQVVITLLSQLVLFAPLVLLRFTLLRDPAKPRPFVALAGFAVATALRVLVVDELFHQLAGLPQVLYLRIGGFLPTLIPLVLTAYVVNTLTERRREVAALLGALDQLATARNNAEESLWAANDELVRHVRAVMEAELAALSTSRRDDAVARLQQTASDVIRPISHELAASLRSQMPTTMPRPTADVGWRDAISGIAPDRPLRPWTTTFLLFLIWGSGAAVLPAVRLPILGSLPVILVLLMLANVALQPVMRRANSIVRASGIVVAAVVTSVAASSLLRSWIGDWSSAGALQFAMAFYMIFVIVSVAVVSAILDARADVIAVTVASIGELEMQIARIWQLHWYQQRSLARALHGTVQSAVIAAALRIADEPRSLTPELIESVRDDLLAVLDVLNAPDSAVVSLDDGMARIVWTWVDVCEVTTFVDLDARALIGTDASLRACVLDIATEAVSNAVRHGRARVMSISITAGDRTIVIDVADDGPQTLGTLTPGIGSALLDECALAWSLAQTGTGHTLHAVLPTPDPSSPQLRPKLSISS